MTNMKRVSVAEAKAHFSEIVADAERSGRETIVERRGRPIARIAPLVVAATRPKGRTLKDFDAAVRSLEKVEWRRGSAVEDLQRSRERLD